MRKKLLPVLALTILVASTLAGCSGASPTDSTLTVLSITEGTVLVMKTGTDSWTKAEAGMSLEVGDTIKTGDDSGAEITFFDGSTIELEAGTQMEITSLDSSPDTGAKTITLMQTIGTSISRVTKLLDPASTYAIETPSGVAAVRGSTMIVRIVFDDPNYEDGTVLITNLEGDIWAIWNGAELQIPEGRTCVIRPGQLPELIPLNQPPVAISDSAVTDADSPVTVDAPGVLSNDSDPDGDILAVTSLDTSGTLGAVTWSADGSFTYDPDGQFEYLPAGNSTSDSFTYTVSDGNGGTDTATVTVIINGVYDQPVDYPPVNYPPVNYPPVAVDDSATTPQDAAVTINVLSNDSDPDAGDTLTVASVTQGTHGSVINNGTNVAYTPNSGFTGMDSFTYTISDGKGATDTATVTVTVTLTSINHPPVAVDDSATTPQDTTVTINVLSNDSDPDAGDTLTVVSVTQGTHGSVTNNGNNIAYTPNPGYTGTDSFSYTISDGKGGIDTATVTVTVTSINHPPVAVDDSATTPQDTAVTINVLSNDSDPDAGDTLTVVSVTQGTHGSVTNNGSNVTYTPDPGYTGTDSFTYSISDGKGGTDTATVTVSVTAVVALARINVQIDTGPTAAIYIRDDTIGEWAIDEDTRLPVNGQNHITSDTIKVAGGHFYCVWVGAVNATYYAKNYPSGWTESPLEGGGEKVCGLADAGHIYPVHFSSSE